MSKYQHLILHAPAGMNSNSDPVLIGEQECAYLRGFFPARRGMLRPSSPLIHLKLGFSTPQDFQGMLPYYPPILQYNTNIQQLWLLTVRNTLMLDVYVVNRAGEEGQPRIVNEYLNLQYPRMTELRTLGRHVALIGAQYRDEIFFIRGNGGYVYRMYARYSGAGTAFYPVIRLCGLNAPTELVNDGQGGATTGFPTGELKYVATNYDERGRESSPSEILTVNHTSATNGRKIKVTGTKGDEWQDGGIYLYRQSQNSGMFYRVAELKDDQVTKTTSSVYGTLEDLVSEDDLLDKELAPEPGENDPPQIASAFLFAKGRLWLNDISLDFSNATDTNKISEEIRKLSRIQVSNLEAPTQFSLLDDPSRPELGTRLDVAMTPADRITAFGEHGSVITVFALNSRYGIWGDNPSEFSVRHLGAGGCASPAAVQKTEAGLFFVSKDGVYLQSGADMSLTKISAPIDNLFRGFVRNRV